jgi:thiamine biosynthesis lipoprotein
MSDLYQTEFKAWSCDFMLEIVALQGAPAPIVQAIKKTLAQYEQAFSRFLPNSDLAKLNAGETIPLSPLWKKIIHQAETLSKTIGTETFNPHVNLAAQGYNVSIEKLTARTQAPANAQTLLPFPDGLIIENETIKLKPNHCLDFGSFLKGFVSAELAQQFAPQCDGVIINFGGDMTVLGNDETKRPFQIGIYNPVTKQDHHITLKNQSLCTSGTYKRVWETQTGTRHHILDPQKNNNHPSPFVSISFWGRDAALCDALATAAFNATPQQWEQWRAAHPDLNYLAIHKTGTLITSQTVF